MKLGLGIIGASVTNPGWAMLAHIPALAAVPELELRAVATNPGSARATEAALHVPAVDAHALIARPDIDLVAVTVKVPQHAVLVGAAIDAGKLVMCEWPLGVDLDQARAMAAGAARPTLIGLQLRTAPSVRHAKELIERGYIGEVLATSIVLSGISWTSPARASQAYLFDASHGATLMTVPVMHAIDAVEFVLGSIARGHVIDAIRRPTIELDTGDSLASTVADHIAIAAELESGAVLSLLARGGTTRTQAARWEIHGTEGDLVLTSPIGNLQVLDPHLEGARGSEPLAPLPVPADGAGTGPAANVARLYRAFVADLRRGTPGVAAPDFQRAVRLHETQLRLGK